jgi:hypothetical protein
MNFIKSAWARLRPIFDGLARLDFAWGKVGWGSLLLGKVFPSLAALVVVFEARADSQPIFVLILSGLAAVALTLGAAWLALATLEKIGTTKKSEPVRSKKGSSPQARTKQAQNNTAIILGASIIIATIIAVGGVWVIFNWPTQLQYDQTRLVFTAVPLPPVPDIHQSLGYHVLFNNSGPLEISNYRLQYRFKSTKEPLTNKEADDEFDDVSHRMPDKDLFSNSLPAGGGGSYITLSDGKYTPDDWREVLGGRLLIYMFVTFKYEVGGKTKYSDICLFFNNNYPAVHNCYRNNKTYYDK